MCRGGHNGEGHSRSSQKARRSRRSNGPGAAAAGPRMRPLEHHRGLDGLTRPSPGELYGRDPTGRASIGSTGAAASTSAAMLRRPRSGGQTPPVTGDLVSSRSNVSVYSDWDHMEGRATFVKDDYTGKTHLQMQRVAQAARVRKDAMSHGAHLSSTALTSATSAAESVPGTPENSHTIDAMLGGVDALAAGDGVQSISGEVAGAPFDTGLHSGRAAAKRRSSVASAPDHSPSNSERLLAHEALMVPQQQRQRPPLPPGATNDAAQDVDEESQRACPHPPAPTPFPPHAQAPRRRQWPARAMLSSLRVETVKLLQWTCCGGRRRLGRSRTRTGTRAPPRAAPWTRARRTRTPRCPPPTPTLEPRTRHSRPS